MSNLRYLILWVSALVLVAPIFFGPLLGEAQANDSSTYVVVWGNNKPAGVVVTNLNDSVQISSFVGVGGRGIGLKNDGSIIESSYPPAYNSFYVPPVSNALAVAGSPTYYDGPGYRLALRADGTVVIISSCCSPTLPPPADLSNVVAIASGAWHGLALKSDGTVVSWEDWPSTVPAGLSNVVAIAAGLDYSLALKSDGTVTAWKEYASYTPPPTNVPAGLSNVVAVSASRRFALALKSDGTVVGWGSMVPPALSNIVAISAGSTYGLGLKSDGTVVLWGNEYAYTNVPPDLTNVVAISACEYPSALVGKGPAHAPAAPLHLNLAWGTPLVLPANTSGTVGFSYRWACNGTNISTKTNMALMLDHLEFTNSGTYAATVSNAFSVVTNNYSVTVLPLVITAPLRDQTVYGGSGVTFSIGVSGVNLNYQWQFNGTNLDGATNTTLTLNGVLPKQAGLYSVIVTNAVGALTNSATLTVTPLAISQPQDVSVYFGGTANVSVGVAGNTPIYFQWRFNGTNISDATNVTYTVTNAQSTAVGDYSVIVTNAYDTIISSNAHLFVVPFLFSTDPANLGMTSTGFLMQVDGSAGLRSVVIDASSNLLDWLPLFTNPPAAGSVQFLDAAATNAPRTFYRARQQ